MELAGRLLVATPVLSEPPFHRTVVVLLEHTDADGALGVVLNRPTSIAIDDVVPLDPDLLSPPAALFDGGPVSPTAAIAVGLPRQGGPRQGGPRQGGPVDEGWRAAAPPYVTVDLEVDPALLAAGIQRLRVFAGYAGWAPGQLEGEIAVGAWYVVDALPDDVFAAEPEGLWRAVLRRQGWPLSAVATFPADPGLN